MKNQTYCNALQPRTFNVVSLLALTSIRESALHASLYTAPTCPLSVATNFPVRPFHIRTLLSHAALAAHWPFGLNTTCATWRWCPVRRAMGLSLPPRSMAASEEEVEEAREGKSDHRKSVWSSDPETRSSPCEDTRLLYRASASNCA